MQIHILTIHLLSACAFVKTEALRKCDVLCYKHHFKHLWVLRSSRKTISTDFFLEKKGVRGVPPLQGKSAKLYFEASLGCALKGKDNFCDMATFLAVSLCKCKGRIPLPNRMIFWKKGL